MKIREGINISLKDGKRVVTGLGYYEIPKVSNLRELVKKTVNANGDKVGFKFKNEKGEIAKRTYKEFDLEVDSLGTALMTMGLKGSHIAVISENRYEWGVCYFSVINGVGVAVPLDKYLPEKEIENLIERGKIEGIFYSSDYHEIMEGISKRNSKIKHYICMDPIPNIEKKADISDNFCSKFTTMDFLIRKGQKLLKENNRSFVDANIDAEGMSILLFTSGTTSVSKGVMLSHANIVSNVLSIAATIKTYPTDVHLSLLPLHHTFENTVGLIFMIYRGVCIAYCEGIRHISQNIHEYGVTLLVAVPAILETMYRRVEAGIKASGKEKLVSLLGFISGGLYYIGIDIRRKLFKSILSKLGPGLRLAVSGAAPLDPVVVRNFDKMGLRLVQGYGLTETSPVVAANNDFINVPGSIGHPLAGVEVAIYKSDEDGIGEIITRGKNVMLGYYEDPAATKEAIDANGWFRTGDLGTIDKKGIIRVTGRAKSMIVLTNGKKAFPEEYEILLNNIPGIKESFVWGNRAPDGDIQVCAKLVINIEDFIEAEDQEQAFEGNNTYPEKELAEYFLEKIREINKNIPRYKIIRYFIMTYDDLIKTTTLKIKRNIEYEKTMDLLQKVGIDMRKANGMMFGNNKNP